MRIRIIDKKKLLVLILLIFISALLVYNVFIGVLFLFAGAFSLLSNRLVKKTNWYRNIFIYTNQFVTNKGYRNDLQRNYDIVNLGSNPALFAFFYENVKGQNWATGSQGPEMDLQILRYYHSYIKEGGVVLIPIVAFSSCSTYLTHYKPNFYGMSYYARFAKVLEDGLQARTCIPNYKKVRRWMKYPLMYSFRTVRYLIKDVEPDSRHLIVEQPMSLLELNNDAGKWIHGWMKEFDILDLNAPLDERMEKCHEECADQFAAIVDFCKERQLKPVLVFPPISSVLASRFSRQARETYIYSFVCRVQKRTPVEFLDYMDCEEFSSPQHYFNSFFLNLRGRKLFTHRVLKDLGLV